MRAICGPSPKKMAKAPGTVQYIGTPFCHSRESGIHNPCLSMFAPLVVMDSGFALRAPRNDGSKPTLRRPCFCVGAGCALFPSSLGQSPRGMARRQTQPVFQCTHLAMRGAFRRAIAAFFPAPGRAFRRGLSGLVRQRAPRRGLTPGGAPAPPQPVFTRHGRGRRILSRFHDVS